MSLIPCPRILVAERQDAPEARRWEARFAGRKKPLPMIFRARSRQRAEAMAIAWWAGEQSRRANEIAQAAARAEIIRRRALA